MPKYYLVDAEVFASNFPEEIDQMVADKQVKLFEFEHSVEEAEVISKTILEEYDDSDSKLIALEAAGVDNWEGWDDAMTIYNDMKNKGE